jgi:uncharacterized protein YcfJ
MSSDFRNDTTRDSTRTGTDANRDPWSGASGAHPIGTGIGAIAGGMAAGAATGTVAGPVGTVIGAAIGAVVGGLAGKGVAESIDPTREDAYWRDNYSTQSYVMAGSSYDDYGPAYGYGVSSYGKHDGRTFDEAEPGLSRGWSAARGKSELSWNKAKNASRDAWNRVSDGVERAIPGDPDHDGR